MYANGSCTKINLINNDNNSIKDREFISDDNLTIKKELFDDLFVSLPSPSNSSLSSNIQLSSKVSSNDYQLKSFEINSISSPNLCNDYYNENNKNYNSNNKSDNCQNEFSKRLDEGTLSLDFHTSIEEENRDYSLKPFHTSFSSPSSFLINDDFNYQQQSQQQQQYNINGGLNFMMTSMNDDYLQLRQFQKSNTSAFITNHDDFLYNHSSNGLNILHPIGGANNSNTSNNNSLCNNYHNNPNASQTPANTTINSFNIYNNQLNFIESSSNQNQLSIDPTTTTTTHRSSYHHNQHHATATISSIGSRQILHHPNDKESFKLIEKILPKKSRTKYTKDQVYIICNV